MVVEDRPELYYYYYYYCYYYYYYYYYYHYPYPRAISNGPTVPLLVCTGFGRRASPTTAAVHGRRI